MCRGNKISVHAYTVDCRCSTGVDKNSHNNNILEKAFLWPYDCIQWYQYPIFKCGGNMRLLSVYISEI